MRTRKGNGELATRATRGQWVEWVVAIAVDGMLEGKVEPAATAHWRGRSCSSLAVGGQVKMKVALQEARKRVVRGDKDRVRTRQ